MRLVITGGGTGGHVFPALEIARLARSRSEEVFYLGSKRGQEAFACQRADIPFKGFHSEPLYSLKTFRGWKAILALFRARSAAAGALKRLKPDAVFSTGGYSGAPVASAAVSLGIPLVLHEQNSVPGRSNQLVAAKARAVAVTFHAALPRFKGCNAVRTGMPLRIELRELANAPIAKDLLPMVLVVGGSQGSQALNEAALGAATRMVGRALNWLHVAGKPHFEGVFHTYEKLALKDCYEVKSFLDAGPMAEAYARATVAVGRAGAGTLAELAAFRVPSVLVPYPHAYADHQTRNAAEFETMGAATSVPQEAIHPTSLEAKLVEWLDDPAKRESAARALAEWDVPDASERILRLIQDAPRGPN